MAKQRSLVLVLLVGYMASGKHGCLSMQWLNFLRMVADRLPALLTPCEMPPMLHAWPRVFTLASDALHGLAAILRVPHSYSPLGLLHGLRLEAYVAQMGIMNNQ